MVHHRQKLGMSSEEMLSGVTARLDGIFLVIAVHRLFHSFDEKPFVVLAEKRVPIGAPDHLDHVPTGAVKKSLELLNDFSVAPHGAIEALEIAIDDPHQIV